MVHLWTIQSQDVINVTGPVIKWSKNKMADHSISRHKYVRILNVSRYRASEYRMFTVYSKDPKNRHSICRIIQLPEVFSSACRMDRY